MGEAQASIRGVSAYCPYGPRLQEAVGEALVVRAEAEIIAQRIGGFAYMDTPDHLIAELEEYLEENPCNYAKDGICPVAIFTALKAVGRL